MRTPASSLPQSHLVKGLGWIALAILCWAPLFPVAKRALPYVDAFALGTLRYAIGVVLFIALLVAFEGRRALNYEGRFAAAAIFGVIGITGFNTLTWFGLTYTRPEHGAIIMSLQTPLTALAVWLTRGLRPARFTQACIALALFGVFVVVTKGDPASAFAGGAIAGDLIIFLGALSWVIYTIAGARFAGWSPLRFTVLTCLPGAAGLFVVHAVAIASGLSVVPSAAAMAQIGWQIAYFAICTVVLGVLGFNFAVKYLGALNTMLMLNLIPVSVFVIEAALGRTFAAIEITGAAIVIGALVANNLYLRRKGA